MRSIRIYTPQPLQAQSESELEPEARHHLLQVLRLRSGDSITLFNGDGHDYLARLTHADRKEAWAEIVQRSAPEPPATLRIRLAIAVSKGERMDFAIQKSVELGVAEITPLISSRSVVRLSPERMQKRLDHWQRILVAACEQSGRRRLPQLNPVQEFGLWCNARIVDPVPALVLDHRAESTLEQLPEPGSEIALLAGPEGGFSAEELAAASSAGVRAVRLGPHVLRTETAPLAALAAIHALWGDFRSASSAEV
ncbi:MAG: 16S rRNA (uracil(1498)-N(3))-methyltransferase [Gammaproteobacteria bacterium]|nr:16S rRNA (uracil(1498)-N(3))-methyltransferase [Gammaproteobacteria bacterium]